jgi:hypothetical protein
MRERETAKQFLWGLRDYLADKIIAPDVKHWMETIKRDKPSGKDIPYEGLFTDNFVLPHFARYLCQCFGPIDARKSLLAESSAAKREKIASGTPASCQKHLFTKEIGVPLRTIVDLWWSDSK